MQERRKSIRRTLRETCEATVRSLLKKEDPDGHGPLKGRVLDISKGGTGLVTEVMAEQPIEVNREIDLRMALSDGATIDTRAEVCWVRTEPGRKGYRTGVRFTHVDPANRRKIDQFIAELDQALGR